MAGEILEQWAPVLVGLELKTGSKGVFTVAIDGEIVYDKAATRRKPNTRELVTLSEPLLGPPLTWRKAQA